MGGERRSGEGRGSGSRDGSGGIEAAVGGGRGGGGRWTVGDFVRVTTREMREEDIFPNIVLVEKNRRRADTRSKNIASCFFDFVFLQEAKIDWLTGMILQIEYCGL